MAKQPPSPGSTPPDPKKRPVPPPVPASKKAPADEFLEDFDLVEEVPADEPEILEDVDLLVDHDPAPAQAKPKRSVAADDDDLLAEFGLSDMDVPTAPMASHAAEDEVLDVVEELEDVAPATRNVAADEIVEDVVEFVEETPSDAKKVAAAEIVEDMPPPHFVEPTGRQETKSTEPASAAALMGGGNGGLPLPSNGGGLAGAARPSRPPQATKVSGKGGINTMLAPDTDPDPIPEDSIDSPADPFAHPISGLQPELQHGRSTMLADDAEPAPLVPDPSTVTTPKSSGSEETVREVPKAPEKPAEAGLPRMSLDDDDAIDVVDEPAEVEEDVIEVMEEIDGIDATAKVEDDVVEVMDEIDEVNVVDVVEEVEEVHEAVDVVEEIDEVEEAVDVVEEAEEVHEAIDVVEEIDEVEEAVDVVEEVEEIGEAVDVVEEIDEVEEGPHKADVADTPTRVISRGRDSHAEDAETLAFEALNAAGGPESSEVNLGQSVEIVEDEIAEVVESDTDLAATAKASEPTKKKGAAHSPDSEPEAIDIDQLFEDHDSSAVALGDLPGEESADKAASSEPKARVLDEEPPIPPAAKGKAGKGDKPPKKVVPAGPRSAKPRYGLRWAGGMVAASLLLGGTAYGAWYLFPGLLQQLPARDGYRWQKDAGPQATPKGPSLSGSILAEGKFDDEAKQKELAESQEKDDINTRALLNWFKYQKDQRSSGKPLSSEDEAVKTILADLKTTENAAWSDHVIKTIETEAKLREEVAEAKQAEKAAKDASVDPTMLAQMDDKLKKSKAELDVLKKFDNQLRDTLAKVKGFDEGDDPATKVDKLAKNDALLKGVRTTLVELKALEEKQAFELGAFNDLVKDWIEAKNVATVTGKLLDAKQESLVKNVEELLGTKKDLDGKLVAVNKQLEAAKIDAKDAKGVEALVTVRDGLAKEKTDLLTAIDTALAGLKEGGLLPAEGDKTKQLVEGVKLAREASQSPLTASIGAVLGSLGNLGGAGNQLVQRGFELADQRAALAAARARVAFQESPEQRLDTWLALLQDRNRKDPKDLDAVVRLHTLVASEAEAKPAAKVKADLALGLAQRNAGQIAEARKSLELASTAAAKLDGKAPWAQLAQQSYKDLTDPSAHFIPAAMKLYQQGQLPAALAAIEEALLVIPNEPRLLTLRSQVRLDLAGSKVDPPTAKLISADAEAATTAKDEQVAAEGFFVLGRLAEEQGDLVKAEVNYRQALKKAPRDDSVEADRYRLALTRLLLRDRPAAAAPAEGEKKDAEKKDVEKAGADEVYDLDPSLFVSVIDQDQGKPGDLNPEEAKRVQESIELAKKLIESKDVKIRAEGHLLLGRALTQQGNRNEGLIETLKGMELLYPGETTKIISDAIKTNPAFHQPDLQQRIDPLLAERHFTRGLEYYWATQYLKAEAEFKKAAGFFTEDARYQYFLGLAQYQQKTKDKRAAAFLAFEYGARLEAKSLPASSDVNASLERIQGDVRALLRDFRDRGVGEK